MRGSIQPNTSRSGGVVVSTLTAGTMVSFNDFLDSSISLLTYSACENQCVCVCVCVRVCVQVCACVYLCVY